jgi:hypothetical protein
MSEAPQSNKHRWAVEELYAGDAAAGDQAAAFYLRLGFEVVGLIPEANGPGKPDELMAKRAVSIK